MLENILLRIPLTFLLRLFFRVEVRGLEHYQAAGNRMLIISNHQSYLDPLMLAVFLPRKPAFAINVFQADKWYFRWFDRVVTLYKLDPLKPLSMKRLIQDLRQDAQVVLFPEGRITTSGGIMKIYDGTGMIVEKTGATVLPVRFDGAEYSRLSRLGGKLRQRWFPKVRMTILPPVRFKEGEAVSSQAIYDIMTRSAFESADKRRSLLDAILGAKEWHGGGHTVAYDITRSGMSYRSLLTRGFILGSKLNIDEKFVGVLLPGAHGAVVTFVALHMLGKVPCMLNFSAGVANILHACRIAEVKTVLTSRAFIEKGKLEEVAAALEKNHRVIYLEDLRKEIGIADKLRGLARGFVPRRELRDTLARVQPDDPAVVLYTSGSEGVPKGVALSHANLLANIHQACAKLDLTSSDLFFNALPLFHSFGLMAGMLLPLVTGVRTFLYPSPLHYRVIPDLVYDSDATVMLGTDTFYNGYARYAHDYDFWNIRLAVAGAEKLRESTRRLYAERFGMTIYEGYGVTETSPVISVNTPLEHKHGTVGRPLPGIECRLEPVEGLEEGGRLLVKGSNVMLGYLKADQPGIVQPQEEWYDTGDIVAIDGEGYIRIQGRAKRFAKIGGEMVSLAAVEEMVLSLSPDVAHAALSVPDERKGEQIVLFTEAKELTREQIVQHAREHGIAEISLPRRIIPMDALPRLGNGKIDYMTLKGKV